MSDQSRTVQDILMDRLAVTQKLSALTAEHLRLSQQICGIEVLEMGGIEDTGSRMAEEHAALAACEDRIETLENDMARLDRELEGQSRGEPE